MFSKLVTLFHLPAFTLLSLLIIACAPRATATQTPLSPPPKSTNTSEARRGTAVWTSQPTVIQVPSETLAIPVPLSCEDWQSWPIIPVVGESMRELYERGQAEGNNPRAFSKIGDGEIAAEWFLTAFDLDGDHYDLGPHQNLLPVIEYFHGSFERIGMAARRGFNAQRILDPAARDLELCESSESPLTCELRLHRPAFAILSLGTNQVWQPEEFEGGMKQILKILLSHRVLPILSTKGDNLEGDHRINGIIACLAQEYDVPLWNFWSAIQSLPDHGLQPDLEHLAYGINDFDDPYAMQSAWTVRNLTALQVLDSVWRSLTVQP